MYRIQYLYDFMINGCFKATVSFFVEQSGIMFPIENVNKNNNIQ